MSGAFIVATSVAMANATKAGADAASTSEAVPVALAFLVVILYTLLLAFVCWVAARCAK